jgi:hypothetical protein
MVVMLVISVVVEVTLVIGNKGTMELVAILETLSVVAREALVDPVVVFTEY